MREIKTEVLINAPIEKIWSILLDFENYNQWNPFIKNIEGNLRLGEKLKVEIIHDNEKSMMFYPTVKSISEYEFSWVGVFGSSKIFSGHHCFLLEEFDERVKFTHSEKFSGILSFPLLALIGKSTKAGFIAMNKALKEKCEFIA